MSLTTALRTGDVTQLPGKRDEDWRWTDLRGLLRVLPPPSSAIDLAGLPAYTAQAPNVHGVVRIHDSELTQPLVHLWQDRFLKLHPLVRYKEYTVPAWFNGLCADTADLAMAGRRAYLTELKAFESVHGYPPLEIMFATGGFNSGKGNTPGFGATILATIVAFVVGYLVIIAFLKIVTTYSYQGFVRYRIGLAVVVVILLVTGALEANAAIIN